MIHPQILPSAAALRCTDHDDEFLDDPFRRQLHAHHDDDPDNDDHCEPLEELALLLRRATLLAVVRSMAYSTFFTVFSTVFSPQFSSIPKRLPMRMASPETIAPPSKKLMDTMP